jgi:DNA-binding response OmpR family regulator
MSRRVLIVEDNPDCRNSLGVLLQLWGYEVQTAADGLQGLEKGLSWKPDTVVSDIGLPRIDGFEVARRLRDALGDRVRLVALTACGEAKCRFKAYCSGFDDYLQKPADPEELHRVVNAD